MASDQFRTIDRLTFLFQGIYCINDGILFIRDQLLAGLRISELLGLFLGVADEVMDELSGHTVTSGDVFLGNVVMDILVNDLLLFSHRETVSAPRSVLATRYMVLVSSAPIFHLGLTKGIS